MYTVTVTGFDTKKQAEAFAKWYENTGEQIISECLNDSDFDLSVESMNTDMDKYSLEWKEDNNLELPLIIRYRSYD